MFGLTWERNMQMSYKAMAAYSCVVCGTALEGPVGRLMQVFGIHRSSQNPNLCSRCGTHLEDGRIVEMTVIFADLVGFTAMTSELGPERSYEIVDSFFQKANEILVNHDAYIDKYIGDAVMAIFNAPIQSVHHARKALAAAIDLVDSLPSLREQVGRDIQVRVGVSAGFARVGRIGSHDRKDYTAIGDVVNLASRLVAMAHPGEIVIDSNVYGQVAEQFPDMPAEVLEIKGFQDPVRIHRIHKGTSLPGQVQQLDPLPNIGSRQAISLGSILFAILGAPCAATALLGPLSLLLGVGSFVGAVSPFLVMLDQPGIRLPLQALVVLGSLINLYTIWYGYKRRQGDSAQISTLTQYERRKVMLVGAMSILTVAVIGSEWYVHVFLERQPLL